MGSRLHADHWISLFLERPYRAGLRFVRRGEIGQQTLLQGAPGARLQQHFGPMMERLGYRLVTGSAAAEPLSEELRRFVPIG